MYNTQYTLITPSGEIYITGDRNTVYYSNDNGDTWVDKGNNGLPSGLIAIYPLILGKDGTLYAGVGQYPGVGQNGVYRSTNGGDTWLPPSNYNNNSPNAVITDLTISDDGSIFAAEFINGLLKSSDKGVTWSQVNMGFDFEFIGRIMYNTITKDIFVCAVVYDSRYYSMIYRSNDLGASWELQNEGLPTNAVTNAIVFNPNTGQMFASCNGYVYRSTAQVIFVDEPEEIPTTYSLSQNYPNPFNPTTIIQYSIPKDEFVKLTVYDISGKVVTELVSGYKSAGKYSVEFNAGNYASGTYYYKLEAGEYKNIQKMVLVK
jgi:photosystem II stability/assembly factor-like uncharacterized protein